MENKQSTQQMEKNTLHKKTGLKLFLTHSRNSFEDVTFKMETIFLLYFVAPPSFVSKNTWSQMLKKSVSMLKWVISFVGTC